MPPTVRNFSGPRYPISDVHRGDGAAHYLHRSVVEALSRFKASYRRPLKAGRASQAYTDTLAKGRSLGTLTLGRLLLDGRAHGACKSAALAVVEAFRSAVHVIWPEPTPSVREALLAETAAEGCADLAELRCLSNPSVSDYDRAIEAQQKELVAEQQLLDALLAERMRLAAGGA